jgi:hypothetical protein
MFFNFFSFFFFWQYWGPIPYFLGKKKKKGVCASDYVAQVGLMCYIAYLDSNSPSSCFCLSCSEITNHYLVFLF